MHRVAAELESVAKEAGVIFFYNKVVEKIETEGNKAKRIICSDGTATESDLIVINANLPYAYRNLLPDKKISAKLENKKYTCSAIVFHWGLSKVYPQFGHHSIFLSDQYRKSLDAIFDHHCGIKSVNSGYEVPVFDIKEAATPCAVFSYIVHIIRDFQKDQHNNLNYFADELLDKHRLNRRQLKLISFGGEIPQGFRERVYNTILAFQEI